MAVRFPVVRACDQANAFEQTLIVGVNVVH
jgi:hypothetical protein